MKDSKINDLFPEYLESRRRGVENALSDCLPAAASPVSSLVGAMRYATFSGGKRLRPLLCIAAAEMCGGTAAQVLPAACALELIHTFSLIHDDLPALDNDSVRRGIPACHVQFGEAVAILAGDALLVRAFELFGQQESLCTAPQALRVIRTVSQALGVGGMVGGQVADLEAERTEVSPSLLEFIHTSKTGTLIRVSAMTGGILAGAGEDVISALEIFGEALGLAFQIQDDFLGATGDPAKLGKPVGKDDERGKATYPRVHGLEDTQKAAEEKIRIALSSIGPFGEPAEPLRRIALALLQRDR